MSSINDGGPAFPLAPDRWTDMDGVRHMSQEAGMSLRDYFAGQALAAKMAPGLIGYEDHAPEHRSELIRRLARDCFAVADAMLAARAGGGK